MKASTAHEEPILDQPSMDTTTLEVEGTIPSMVSVDEDLVGLPKYLEEYEAKFEVKVLPSTRGTISREVDTQNLTSLLSTPIKCEMTLGELLKAIPHLWQDLDETLKKLGIKAIEKQQIKEFQKKNQGEFVV